ncbi:hypothetical protein C8034_v006798 [Colletotrichum sidae]|uniref:Uncharacterized protein n=1 Tax=Colletotrichum sidae TaxID=1347389 RepID=A0A4R8T583_9PEZI|nr:hypothetical protein C8034_v006798 [Colletotrichum sidae]
MDRPHRPPPLTIPPQPQSRTRVRRQRRPNYRQARQFKRWMLRAQIANDVAHVAAASILLWIMSWFLYNVPFPLTYRTGPAAVVLIIILSTDILLDARSIVHAHDPWPAWALVFRLVLGAALIAIFWVYIALSDVFAPGFTYWGMNDTYGRVLSYMFLWGIGLWNLLFVLLCRHWLGKELRRYRSAAVRVLARRHAQRVSSVHDLRSAEPNNRVAAGDLEAARAGESRVVLPSRMGVRRIKTGGNVSVSVSVESVSSAAARSSGPPMEVAMRPA